MAFVNDPRLILTLRHLLWLAQKAYWSGKTDCGSDFDPTGICIDCQHFEICGSNAVIVKNIALIESEVGG